MLGPLPTTILLIIAGLYMLYTPTARSARPVPLGQGRRHHRGQRPGDLSRDPQGPGRDGDVLHLRDFEHLVRRGGRILTVTLGGGREAKFDLDFFDSLDRLKEFAALLQK